MFDRSRDLIKSLCHSQGPHHFIVKFISSVGIHHLRSSSVSASSTEISEPFLHIPRAKSIRYSLVETTNTRVFFSKKFISTLFSIQDEIFIFAKAPESYSAVPTDRHITSKIPLWRCPM
jgi:hypothetical protein